MLHLHEGHQEGMVCIFVVRLAMVCIFVPIQEGILVMLKKGVEGNK